MTKRITYIDALKGLAIILVVWGHIAEKSMGVENMPFNYMYGSFHMPLFIFLSGLFAYKGMQKASWQYVGNFLRKKAVRILLPFLVIGGCYSLIVEHSFTAVYSGEMGGYWFLPALFICMVMGLVQRSVALIFRGGKIADLLAFILVWGAASSLWVLKLPIPYWLAALKSFPYFMAGHFFASYGLLTGGFIQKQWVKTSAILLYVAAMAYTRICGGHFLNFTGLFAIMFLLALAAQYEGRLPKWLSAVGRYSLEIYVLHWFFLPKMPSWGAFLLGQDSFNGNFILTAMVCSMVSVFIIAACIIVAKIIKLSDLLDYLCFGVSHPRDHR